MRALIVLCLLAPVAAWAVPEYGVRTGQACGACHVDPAGGGLRGPEGWRFQVDQLATWSAGGAGFDRAAALGHLWSHPEAPADVRLSLDARAGWVQPLDGAEARQPAQTDLTVAVRPYNPAGAGPRLTLVGTAGLRRAGPGVFGGHAGDRALLRQAWLMLHDLPAGAYVRAGRFVPAHGWRFDDATAAVRSGPRWFGAPLDADRAVTGVEAGLAPAAAPWSVLASGFVAADDWTAPVRLADGGGGALSLRWRTPGWQVGASATAGVSGEGDDAPDGEGAFHLVYSVNWALNPQAWWAGLPAVVYLGELLVDHPDRPGAEPDEVGLAASHALSWWLGHGVEARLKYHWRDESTRFAHDTRHRADLALRWTPLPFLALVGQYAHRWRHTDDRFDADDDTASVHLHAFY